MGNQVKNKEIANGYGYRIIKISPQSPCSKESKKLINDKYQKKKIKIFVFNQKNKLI